MRSCTGRGAISAILSAGRVEPAQVTRSFAFRRCSSSKFSTKAASYRSPPTPASSKASPNAPRPSISSARPSESRSRLAKSSNTRTGSAAPSTVTALDRRMRRVTAAIAARTTAGEETA